MELTEPCHNIKFCYLCKVFQQISSTKTKVEKLAALKNCYISWKNNKEKKESFYNVLRLIIPKYDNDRKSYGLKENSLARKFLDVLCLSKNSNEGKRLVNFKSVKGTKDFPDALYPVLRDRCHGSRVFSVGEVNDLLDSIQAGVQNHSKQVTKVLELITTEMRAPEITWLMRLVLKDLHLGLSEKSVLGCLESGAQAAYTLCSNLKELCSKLESLESLTNDISLGQVFKPMVADRLINLNNVVKVLDNKPFFVETKYDGERMQVHKNGSDYLYFSRGLLEYSSKYGATPAGGTLTPRLHPMLDAHTCILDGEIMVYDAIDKVIVTKAQGQDARNLTSNARFKPCLIVFDILLYNGKSLMTTELEERRKVLDRVVREKEGCSYLSRMRIRSTNTDVLNDLNTAIENEEEGIMVKKPSSSYVPDGRVDCGWFKIKPDYLEQLSDTLDVIILGGYYGKGSGSGTICHFLCGLATGKGKYSSFCKVASGLTNDDLNNKISKLTPYWIPFSKLNIPKEITLGTNAREKPNFLIHPHNSILIEIRAAELMGTTFFALPYTARFPRVVRVRDDKSYHDCTTLDEIEKIQKISKRGVCKIQPEALKPSPKKRKVQAAPSPAKIELLHIKGTSLEGRLFCVLSSSDTMTKVEGERILLENSGEVVQTPLFDCTVVCGRQSVSVKNILANAQHVMLDIHWLELCKEKTIACPPHLVLFCPPEKREEMLSTFDEWGDSFTEDVTPDTLRQQFDLMTMNELYKNFYLKPDTRREIARRYLPQYWRFALNGFAILFPLREVNSSLQHIVELHGGEVVFERSGDVTHVLDGDVDGTVSLTEEELLNILKPYLDETLFKEFVK